ncbi:Tol-Pal system peptidoglycan-associated lipoprotein PAL [Olavius algarvensis Delta 1 endosymbiont]|nr:Tol-Pal system peptidoglycan-associated lipoprotein PAL [Olavius algarvensis Delta 1 endosymbiont]
MCKILQLAIIFFVMLPILILLPACSKKMAETPGSDAEMQEEDSEAQKNREEMERERGTRERELRAEVLKFMREDIYFDKGSYRLGSEAREQLQTKAQWLQKNPDLTIIVEGHTDEAGSKEYNLALGDRRAGAVKSFLMGQGVQSRRITAVSYGNEQPKSSGSAEKARSKNRRVHFVVEE